VAGPAAEREVGVLRAVVLTTPAVAGVPLQRVLLDLREPLALLATQFEAAFAVVDDVGDQLGSVTMYALKPGNAIRTTEPYSAQRSIASNRSRLNASPCLSTVAEIAAELDVEPGTVGKHLRAVEATVFSRYVR